MMNIQASLTASGLPWKPRSDDTRLATTIAQQHGISELLAGIVAGRNIALDDVQQFLNPTLRDYLPDPFHLLDMEKAVSRMIAAIIAQQKIAVFGDYDVDGATSSALLLHYFDALGVHVIPYIPDRMSEGYGPTIGGFQKLIDSGVQLIITVDCGTLAQEPIAYAASRGVDVIVLDHHLSSGQLPPAYAIVNPNRIDETSEQRQLAAVGVTFLTLVALNKTLRSQGFFAQQPEPPLLPMLDIVALGTVCDVMPLTGLNRAFVSQGLKVMAQRKNLGLSLLSDVARMDEAPNTYHLGFLLGPRINAGGRVGKSSLGVELLTATDADIAAPIAQQLDLHNQERQAIEASVSEAAFAAAESQQNMPVILVAGEGWHQGVIGIVAGRLKEKYSRPAMVVALENGVGKGSARSVTGADIGAAIHAAIAQGILSVGGGHAMAAGLTVNADAIAALHAFLIERLGPAVATYNEARVLKYDGMLSVSGASLATLDEIALAGPYGIGNPAPRFVIPNAQIVHRTVMKEKHVKVTLTDASGSGRLNAVAFGVVGTPMGEWLMREKQLHVLGDLKRNAWQGNETAQLMISDVARVD